MATVPSSREGKITFYESHHDAWQTNAVAIGLTTGLVTILQGKTTDARQAFDDHMAAQEAAKAATQNYYNKVAAMQEQGAGMLRTIVNTAKNTNDPDVYVMAQIPAPATPSVTPPPGTPFDFKVNLLQNGAVDLRWKCSNPAGISGTIYEVMRRIGSEGAFEYVGSSGSREFMDSAIPAGSASVVYQVTGVRSTVRGNPAQFTVNFGMEAGGGMMVTSVTAENGMPMKLAA